MLRPLYTTLPWTPTEFYPNPKDQAISAPEDQYLLSPVPQDQSQMATILQPQPQSLSTITYNNLISPLGPNDIPPPTFDMTSQDIHQNHSIYPQYPTTQSFTPSPWSSTSQQLLTPQYPFFPSNIFAYPQPQPHPLYQFPDSALQIPIENDMQEHVIPYPYPINTQQNATDDLFQHDQDNTVLSSYSTTPFGTLDTFGIVHQDDMFQSQHEAVLAPSYEYKPSHVHVQPHSFPSRVFDHSDPNSIIIDSSQNHINRNHKSNIFRSGTSHPSSAAEPITIDPKLSSWGNMILGGEQRTSGPSFGSGTISDRTSAIPVAVPTTPILPIHAQGSTNDVAACRGDDDPRNPSPTKRARWSSSKSTTPLRKRRPPQLHLPPPSSNMRVTTTSAHTAPADTFSLDLFVSPPTQGHINGLGRRVGDSATILPQEPPKIDGWVSPDERPVPPFGYVVPGWDSTPKIFEYDMQNTHLPVVANHQPSLEVQVEANAEPAIANNHSLGERPLPPTFQPYEPTCTPRVDPNPQLRVPNATPGPPPTPYILVPGVNGFEVVPWRPKPQASPMVNTSSGVILPPTTAAPWEVSSAPAIDPSLPPSTASSWESITSLDGYFPIPVPEAEPVPIINDHRGRGRSKSTTRGIHPPPRYYNPPVHRPEPPKQQSVICEICDAYISRTSDLPVCLLLSVKSMKLTISDI
jgi:hypothetical protein